MNKENLKYQKTPANMKSQLQPHQQQGLAWMLYREGHISYSETFNQEENKVELTES